MPHEPQTLRTHVVQEQGLHDRIVLEKYEAPADGEFDVHKDYDSFVANRAMTLLMTHYPGHLWYVACDCKQGIVKVSIPILMGFINFYVIRLHDLTPGKVIAAGGEILERYRLPRGRFEIASFLDARRQHSALVRPWEKVPT